MKFSNLNIWTNPFRIKRLLSSDLQFKNSAVPDQTPRPSNANSNQLRYILDSVLTFCMGPAGLLYCLDDETQRR